MSPPDVFTNMFFYKEIQIRVHSREETSLKDKTKCTIATQAVDLIF